MNGRNDEPRIAALQRDLYRYEKMLGKMHDALKDDDWDVITDLIQQQYAEQHGPRDAESF